MLHHLREWLDGLHEWLIDWADSPAAPVALALITASESIFFPIPTDPLLIALALRHPDAALILAALTIAASVLGGVVGHWLGLRLGRPLLLRLPGGHAERAEALLRRWGFWAVAAAGLTPIPYKVFTIGAGVVGIPRAQFVFGSILGRGLRFGVYGVLIFFWGERFAEFITDRFDLVVSAFAGAAVVLLLAWLGWRGLRARGAGARGAPPV